MHVEPAKKSFNPSMPNDTEPSEEQANFANKNITTLPDELLVKIFSNLDTRDLVNCQRVNRRWQELVDDHMLAIPYYPRCHRAEQRINPLTVERYQSSIQGWLRGFSNLGRESAARLDKCLQHKHFTERLFFSIAKVSAKAKALNCQDVGTITHSYWVNKASFSPDGNYLVTVSLDHSVKISEFVAGRWQEKATTRHLHQVNKVNFSPDGKRLVIASNDKTAQIWELEGGQWRKKNTLQHSNPVSDAFFSPDGRHLVTISYAANIWELVEGQWQTKATIRHFYQVASACFSPDGNHLVTKSFCISTVKIWGLVADQWEEKAEIECYEHGQEERTTRYSGWVFDVCFSPDGNYLVIAVAETPRIWELVDGEWKQSAALEHCSLVYDVRFSPDGKHLVTVTAEWAVKIWGAVDDRWLEKATIPHYRELSITSFSPDGSHLVTASDDRTAKIWGLEGGHWQEKIIIQYSYSVKCASFSPDGKHLVIGSCDGTYRIWGVVDGQWQPKTTIGPGSVRDTSFSPDGTHLVTTFDDIVKVWVLKGKKNANNC